jgi:Arc/MetJ-type ribon-helix-helix transcriptional regulator
MKQRMAGAMPDDGRTAEEKARDIAQAKALRELARNGGLRFEAYLPPALADWILDLVERGVFSDPAEAVFVMLGEQRDMEPHADLRQECLKRTLEGAMRDPHPGFSLEAVNARLEELAREPRPPAAVWERRSAQ